MRHQRARSSIGVAALLLAATHTRAAAQRPFTVDDLGALVSVGDLQFTPDSKSLVFVTRRPDYENNRREPQLVMIDLAGGRERVLPLNPRGISSPVIGPDGRIAALAAMGEGGAGGTQVILLDSEGGPPRGITHHRGGVLAFAWSPDGRTIAYLAPDLPPVAVGSQRFNDSFEVGNDPYLIAAPPPVVHLWIVPTAGGEPRRLTQGTFSLGTSLSTSPIAWSPDGMRIAVQRFPSPHSGDTDKSAVYSIDVASGGMHAVLESVGRQDTPAFSPDGQWLVYHGPRDGVPANMREPMVIEIPRDNRMPMRGRGMPLARQLDRAVRASWLPNGDVLLIGPDGTRDAMWVARRGGAAGGDTWNVQRVALGDVVQISDVAVSATGAVAVVGSERGRPDEVYMMDMHGSVPRRLTDLHGGIAALALGRTEGMRWTSPDGLRPDGVVTYPPGFSPNRRYPLVLFIHGGPTASSLEGFSARPQLFAAQGWIVLQPNYRGSDNLGNAFQAAIARNPGEGIGADVMAGVRTLIRRGIVDTTRMAVSGWSFGGYVSTWLLGNYNVWRAAVVGAAAIDFFDMYALTDLNVQIRHAITASPYTGNREAYFRRQSPLTYASRIRAPTLILHDVYDQRVVIGQSYKLFHALRDNGVETQFIAYPIAAHSPTDPVRSRDVTRRWLEWFQRHLGRVE